MPEHDARGRAGLRRDDLPGGLVEAMIPAVQAVPAVVEGELIGFSVEREAPAGDAIGIAADRHAEIIGMLDIVRQLVIAEEDVGNRSAERRVGKEWGSKCRSRWSP